MNLFQNMRAREEATAEAEAARRADPSFEDVRFLRTRGFVVTGAGNAWCVDGKAMTRAAMHDKAEAVRARMARARVVTTPPPPSPKPVVSAMEARMEGRMANGVLRGKSEREVNDDLEACRDAAGGWTALAALTGAGKSTLSNAWGGHARIGESVMTALYGAKGGDLRPELQALFHAADKVEFVPVPPPMDETESGPSMPVAEAAGAGFPDVVASAQSRATTNAGALDEGTIQAQWRALFDHPLAQPADASGAGLLPFDFLHSVASQLAFERAQLAGIERRQLALKGEAEQLLARAIDYELRINALVAVQETYREDDNGE